MCAGNFGPSFCVCFPSLVNGRPGFSFLSIEGVLRIDAVMFVHLRPQR